MPFTESMILHRRVAKRKKGVDYHETVVIELVDYGMVIELTAEEVNRSLAGSRLEGELKLMLWNVERLDVNDVIELNGNIQNPAQGDMYLLVKMLKDMQRVANYRTYIVKRKQISNA